MGYQTEALIGKMPINLEKIEFYGLAVAIENAFAIVFLDENHLLHWSRKLDLEYTYNQPNFEFDGELLHFFASEIELENYIIAKFDHEFYGVLYKNGERIDSGHINPLLKKLGVKVNSKQNEFHELNLDYYRMSECYYWEGDANWAKLKDNIIAGRIK